MQILARGDSMQILSELSTPFVSACGELHSAITRDIKSKTPIYLRRTSGTTWIRPVRVECSILLLRCTGRTVESSRSTDRAFGTNLR